MKTVPFGKLYLVVGNSGSGKDSIINGIVERWDPTDLPLHVAHRYITRPKHESEEFISIDPEKFHEMEQNQEFSIVWQSYGLYYGVPTIILDWLKSGCIVIVNVSRSVIPEVKAQIPNTFVVFIHVPIELIKNRILERGRETPNDPQFQARLQRATNNQELPIADFIVNNDKDLEHAISEFLKILRQNN